MKLRSFRRLDLLLGMAGILSILLVGISYASPRERKPGPAQKPALVDFVREVQPILKEKCYQCHGPDERKRQANLRFDSRAAFFSKAASGQAPVVPGKPDTSPLVIRISTTSPIQMPPPGTGKKLSPEDIRMLKLWVAQGAHYVDHWAFIAPKLPVLPQLPGSNSNSNSNSNSRLGVLSTKSPNMRSLQPSSTTSSSSSSIPQWSRNPIDRFILAKLLKSGLTPNPQADRYTLIRRVSLDLTGLPPTPQEVDEFANDRSPNAFENVVDRLLASPHFGEKWSRMWLDLARYADSAGYGSDPLRPNIWPWRDWVINAFNKNMPYDEFTVEQLAGDLLPNPTKDQLIATAFHRNTMTNTEGGTDREEFRTAAVKDRTITTSQVWMGLTMGCAQCHSHKFDPINNREFYRFMAFFNQTEDNDQPNESPTMPLPTPDQVTRTDAIKGEIAALEVKANADPKLKPELDKKKKELADINPVALPVMRELPQDKRRESHVLVLANFLQKGDKVDPGVPASLNPWPAGAPMNRLGVAKWLISRDNPLTARVAVNRFWAQLFGRGIVETEEDFGHQGSLPTHPELLDWLAVTFIKGDDGRWTMDDGKSKDAPPSIHSSTGQLPSSIVHRPSSKPWDIKALLKLIVTSQTYQQSSRVTPQHVAKDPRNLLLARYPRRRLDAETVRDQALAISGLLSQKIGGPSVFPPQPPGMWQAAFNGERTWTTSTGEDRYRRGMYTFWRRTVPYPSMACFDAPSREICTMRRIPTNTPLQALVTLNDPVYLEMAQALGRRIVKEGGSTTEERAKFALRLALARPPKEEQVKTLMSLFDIELNRYRSDPERAKKLSTDPLGPLPAGLDAAEQAAWTIISNVLLNLDGVLTIG